MEPSPNTIADALKRAEPRAAVCPEHGEYVSQNLFRAVWSKCPDCDRAKAEERERAEAAERLVAAQRRHSQRLDLVRIPGRFVGRSFDNFAATTDAQRHALTVARDFAEAFDEHARKGRGLIFSGLPGTGKSHLAAAVLQANLERDVCYTTCLDMIREVRETWRRDSQRSELEVLRTLGSLDLLVIDEIGVQYGTDGEQTIIFDVLDRRYRDVRPTILLTNQDKAGLKAFIGERTFDRLTETCRWVPFDWPSYRAQARKEENAQARPRPLDERFASGV